MGKASGSPLPVVAAVAVIAGAAFAVLNFLKKKGEGKDAPKDANAIVPPSPAGEFHDASHEFVEESPRGTPVNLASRFAVEAASSAEADKDLKLANGKHDDDVEFVEAPSDPPIEEEEEKTVEVAVEADVAESEPAVDGAVDGVEAEAVSEVVEETTEVDSTSEVVQDGAGESVEEEQEGGGEVQGSKLDELLERANGTRAKMDKLLEENAPKA